MDGVTKNDQHNGQYLIKQVNILVTMPAQVKITAILERQLLAQYGERLKRARKSLALSSSELAMRVGVSRTTLQAVESGEPSVTLGSYMRVMAELGMGADLALLGTHVAMTPVAPVASTDTRHGSRAADAAILAGNGKHAPQDLQSLRMHQEAVRLIESDPSLVQRAWSTLERWRAKGDPRTLPLWDEWRRILLEHDWSTALTLSEQGQQLRQASPLSTLLPNDTRLRIIREIKALKKKPGEHQHAAA